MRKFCYSGCTDMGSPIGQVIEDVLETASVVIILSYWISSKQDCVCVLPEGVLRPK